MTWENSAITIATLLPIAGALVILLVPKDREQLIRGLGIVVTGAALVVAVAIAIGFDYGASGLQDELDVNWISAIGARYHVGIDGISMPLYVLTFLLSFLCAIYTWRFVPDPGRTKVFLALMLLLETGMAGTFIAFDLILFFVFWEMVLVPMYFLIGIWGSANREYAAIKFFLYTLFGSVFMLLGFLGLYFSGPDPHTFDLVKLTEFGASGGYERTFQLIVFGAIALGFAVKVPMWPFHTWLPDAHTEAPTIGSVLLAGIATLTTLGIQAAIFGMVAHGVITGMLFFCVGSIYDRYHTREISEIGGGMLQAMPKLGSVFAFVAIASLGLPGLAGFWGELMALLSSFSPNQVFLADQVGLFRVFMVMGGVGTVLTAGYFLWMLQRVNMGTVPDQWREAGLRDVLVIE